METNPDWNYLIDRYMHDRLTREELQLLLKMAAAREDNPELTKALKDQWDQGKEEPVVFNAEHRVRLQELFENDRKERALHSPLSRALHPPFSSHIRTRTIRAAAVAACLLLLAGSIGYRLWQPGPSSASTEPIQTTAQRSADVQPGYTGAILTLANGEHIVLDSAANGRLAIQGNSEVIQQGGQLSYHSSLSGSAETVYNTINTPRGRQYVLQLPDGSRVWLNAASSLQYPTAFSGKDRTVTLNGEAYFEIAPDVARPFIVQVNGIKVDVLGTSFNIKSYDDEPSIETSLLSGAIRLRSGAHQQQLKPGQQALVQKETPAVITIRNTDEAGVLAWKNGYFQFGHTSVPLIMKQLERWYNIQVRYQGKIPEREFYGEMERSLPLSSILQFLEKNHIHFTQQDHQLTVYE